VPSRAAGEGERGHPEYPADGRLCSRSAALAAGYSERPLARGSMRLERRMSRPVQTILCTLALLLTSCAQAQPAAGGGKAPDLVNPAGGAAQPPKVSPDASIDQVLDALDARGKGLKGFSANVTLSEEDDIGLSSTRTG